MTARIRREIKEHPDKFDYADIPRDYNLSATEQARNEASRPAWLKALVGSKKKS